MRTYRVGPAFAHQPQGLYLRIAAAFSPSIWSLERSFTPEGLFHLGDKRSYFDYSWRGATFVFGGEHGHGSRYLPDLVEIVLCPVRPAETLDGVG